MLEVPWLAARSGWPGWRRPARETWRRSNTSQGEADSCVRVQKDSRLGAAQEQRAPSGCPDIGDTNDGHCRRVRRREAAA